jgi:hypothetical protein
VRRLRWCSTLLVATIGLGCVGPARTTTNYRLKARNSAKAAASAVATSQLAATLVRHDDAPWPYVAVVLDSAERDASSVESTFGSIQPPNPRSDHLRDALGHVLNDAVDTISKMRIAARRDARRELLDAAQNLPRVARELRAYQDLSA